MHSVVGTVVLTTPLTTPLAPDNLQVNTHVAVLCLSPGMPSRRAVTSMGSNDLVEGEDHMLGPSFQRYKW